MPSRRTLPTRPSADTRLQVFGSLTAAAITAAVSLYMFRHPSTPPPPPPPPLVPFKGRVVDAVSLNPVSNAAVLLVSNTASPECYTDSDGVFAGQVDNANTMVIVVVTATGFDPFTKQVQTTDSPVPVTLTRIAVPSRSEQAPNHQEGTAQATDVVPPARNPGASSDGATGQGGVTPPDAGSSAATGTAPLSGAASPAGNPKPAAPALNSTQQAMIERIKSGLQKRTGSGTLTPVQAQLIQSIRLSELQHRVPEQLTAERRAMILAPIK